MECGLGGNYEKMKKRRNMKGQKSLGPHGAGAWITYSRSQSVTWWWLGRCRLGWCTGLSQWEEKEKGGKHGKRWLEGIGSLGLDDNVQHRMGGRLLWTTLSKSCPALPWQLTLRWITLRLTLPQVYSLPIALWWQLIRREVDLTSVPTQRYVVLIEMRSARKGGWSL